MNTLILAGLLAAAASRPEPGQKAPTFSLEASTGNKMRLQDLRGRSVVLAFFPKAFTSG